MTGSGAGEVWEEGQGLGAVTKDPGFLQGQGDFQEGGTFCLSSKESLGLTWCKEVQVGRAGRWKDCSRGREKHR